MNERYLNPMPGGNWVISRLVDGRWISLHQDNPLFAAGDGEAILGALTIPITRGNLDRYFPAGRQKTRCPTLELMELCNVLDPTNPFFRKRGSEAGV